jgi:hypothetical protein
MDKRPITAPPPPPTLALTRFLYPIYKTTFLRCPWVCQSRNVELSSFFMEMSIRSLDLYLLDRGMLDRSPLIERPIDIFDW